MGFDDIDCLKRFLSEMTISSLRQFYLKTRDGVPDEAKESLHMELIEIVQEIENDAKSRVGYWDWEISPSGDNHLVVLNDLCVLITLYGVKVLFSDDLFCEGELGIVHIQWMEEDHLLVFKLVYLYPSRIVEYICHYTNNSTSFVYRTQPYYIGPSKLWELLGAPDF